MLFVNLMEILVVGQFEFNSGYSPKEDIAEGAVSDRIVVHFCRRFERFFVEAKHQNCPADDLQVIRHQLNLITASPLCWDGLKDSIEK